MVVESIKNNELNKGFTLIEILSVIIIIAVISIIATPIITGIIEDSKKAAFKISVEGIIKATETDVALKLSDNNYIYEIINGKINNLDNINISNIDGYNGTIRYDNEANVIYTIKSGKYCAIKLEEEIKIFDNNEDCQLPVEVNHPVLDEKMIAIYYDGVTAKIADSSYSKRFSWYNYSKRKWANAVVLVNNPSKTYNVGDTLLESDVAAYFVWIPRYEYTLYSNYGVNGVSKNAPGYVDIKFTKLSEKNYDGTASYTDDVPSNYRTQDAFKYGLDDLPGIWVGKFETTYGTNTNGYPNNIVVDNVTIKPNVTSLRNQNIYTQFEQAKKLGEIYNLTYETTMLKNDEWNAVAILSQSIYGRCPVDNTCPEISINNSKSLITGSSGGSFNSSSSAAVYTYETDKGVTSSTTMNITGIYDMSGGAWEYGLGVLVNSNGKPYSGSSGYAGVSSSGNVNGIPFLEEKYYTVYTSTSKLTACNKNKCYGLVEFQNWYGDLNNMVSENSPWLSLGGNFDYGTGSGFWHLYNYTGRAHANISFRISIRPIL